MIERIRRCRLLGFGNILEFKEFNQQQNLYKEKCKCVVVIVIVVRRCRRKIGNSFEHMMICVVFVENYLYLLK